MYKSLAQARYMHAAAKRGEISKSVVNEFDDASAGKMDDLPEYVKKWRGGAIRRMACGGVAMSRGGMVPRRPMDRWARMNKGGEAKLLVVTPFALALKKRDQNG